MHKRGVQVSGTSVLVAIVVVATLTVAAVVGVFAFNAEKSTPLIVSILGFAGTTVSGLFVLLRVEKINGTISEHDEKIEQLDRRRD